MTDSAHATDYSQAGNRTFIFSQETTPNTPVALGIQASIAMPGIWTRCRWWTRSPAAR